MLSAFFMTTPSCCILCFAVGQQHGVSQPILRRKDVGRLARLGEASGFLRDSVLDVPLEVRIKG